MRNRLKDVIRTLLFLGLGLLLIWLIVRDFTPDQWAHIRQAFLEANYFLLIPVFGIGLSSHYLRALRWRLLLHPMGYRTRISNVFAAVMIGYLTNLAVPRLGEVARCGVLARQERIAVDRVIGTMVAERLIDVCTLAIVILVTVLLQPGKVSTFFYQRIGERLTHSFLSENWTGVVLLLLLLVAVVVLLVYFFRRTAWFQKGKKLLKGMKEGLFMAFHLQRKGLFLLFTLMIWLCYFLMVYIGFYCFASTSGLGVKAALSVLSFGSIGMALTQGGLGAYQLLVEKTLTLYGVSEVYGFAFGWLSWLAQTALILLAGFGALMALPFLRRPTAENPSGTTVPGP